MLRNLLAYACLLCLPIFATAQTTACTAVLECPPTDTVAADSLCSAVYTHNLPSIGGNCYGSLLITEASPNSPDFVEVLNLAGNADYTGWIVVVSDSYSNINSFNTNFWTLGTFTANQIQYREDNTGPNYWGNNIFWSSGSNSWVMIIDDQGDVVDALFWGWSSAQIAAFSATINNFNITIPSTVWSGNGVNPACTSGGFSRVGSGDSNMASDWGCGASSKGLANPNYTPGGGGGANAPVPQLIGGLPSGSTFPLGVTTMTYTASDTATNFNDSCSFDLLVRDVAPPIALCQNVTVQLNANGFAFLNPSDVDNASFDNCTIASRTLSQDTFACPDIGFNQTTLTVTDNSGNVNTCAATVTVEDTGGVSSVPVNLGPDLATCNNSPVTLTAGPGFASYQWNTGATTPSITVNSPGIYTLNVTDAAGCTGLDNILVTNYTVPASNAQVSGGPAFICNGQTLDLVADNGFTTYLWSTGSTSNSTTISQGGQYTLVVSDTSNCDRTDTIDVVQVNAPAPVVSVLPSGSPVYACDGNDLILDAGAGFASYSWSNGFITQQAQLGVGTYQVTVIDNNGCWDTSGDIEIRDTSATIPTISVNGAQLCSSPASGYSWSINTIPLGVTTQCFQPSQNGTYTVTITDQYGCEAQQSITFVSNEPGFADLLSVDVAPNPFASATEISFGVPFPTSARLIVYDLEGREIATLFDGEVFPQDRYEVEFRPENHADGIYIYRLVTETGQVSTGKLMLMR